MDLTVSYIYGEAWDFAKKNWLRIAAYIIFSGIVGALITTVTLPAGFWMTYLDAIQGDLNAANRMQHMTDFSAATYILQYVVNFALLLPLYAGLVGICRGTTAFDLSIFRKSPMHYGKFIAGYFLYVIAIIIGLICLLVPGIYVAIRWSLAPFYLAEHPEAGIQEAFSRSWSATKGHVLEMIGLALLAIVLAVAIIIPCTILIAIGAFVGVAGLALAAIFMVAALSFASVVIYLAFTMTYVSLVE